MKKTHIPKQATLYAYTLLPAVADYCYNQSKLIADNWGNWANIDDASLS